MTCRLLLCVVLVSTVASLTGACLDADTPDLADTEQAVSILFRGGLEPPPVVNGPAEVDLQAGRAANVPVSFVWEGAHRVDGAHTLRIRATCNAGATRLDCDPSMLISYCDTSQWCGLFPGRVHVTDDARAGGAPQNAYFEWTATQTSRYQVRVYSANRATSAIARIEWSTDGTTWSTQWDDAVTNAANTVSGGAQHVGGTLVDVGALQAGDGVEVRTPSNGAGDEATRMWLFSLGTTPYIFFSEQQAGDGDPRIEVSGGWSTSHVYVLLGKDARAYTKAGIETYVDVVRTPLNDYGAEQLVDMNGGVECTQATCVGSAVTLPAGRYYAYVNVRLSPGLAFAQFTAAASTKHLASDLGDISGQNCDAVERGQGNDRAFTLVVKHDGAVVSTRPVPRALLGNDPTLPNPWHYIIAEIDSNGTGTWSLEVRDNRAIINGRWKYNRNPDVTELKVASYNIYYKADSRMTEKMQNAADLLGTRGAFVPSSQARLEQANRAAWQWEADVIGLQEIDNYSWAQTFHDRLIERTAVPWQMVYANTEITSDWFTAVFNGPIFANRFVTPASGSILFDQNKLAAAGCNSAWESGGATTYACPLGVDTDGLNRYRNAVPARLSARRLGGVDRPVTLFNWHLLNEDERQGGRRMNVEHMITRARALIGQVPGAFNKDGVNDPKHPGNRFIIIGDSNGLNNQCGEFTGWIRRLREEFGYAVDVSSAALDGDDRTWDQHYSGAPITDPLAGSYGNCQDPRWARPTSTNGAPHGRPYHFVHRADWQSTPDPSTTSWFPWWASSSRNAGFGDAAGNRFDVIILVGRGWSTDDPVRGYAVMADRQEPSAASGYLGGGVEMYIDSSNCGAGLAASGYAPQVALPPCGTTPGAPALVSDHKPIGARLRIYAR